MIFDLDKSCPKRNDTIVRCIHMAPTVTSTVTPPIVFREENGVYDTKRRPPHVELTEFASPLIHDRLYFGGAPDALMWEALERHNMTLIVNLLTETERRIFPYPVKKSDTWQPLMWHLPVPDQQLPEKPDAFLNMVRRIVQYMRQHPRSKVYVHCRGGHGRSPMMAGCILSALEGKVGAECIDAVSRAHWLRKRLSAKYYRQLCPVANRQRTFLHTLSSVLAQDRQGERRVSVH